MATTRTLGMIGFQRLGIAFACLGLTACSMFGGSSKPSNSTRPFLSTQSPDFTTTPPQSSSMSLSREVGAYGRLQMLYWPLASAASAYCAETGVPSVGSVPASQFDYGEGMRAEASRVLGVDERPRFTEIFPNTPAARGGILAGDVLLSVGRQRVQGDANLARVWVEELANVQRPNAGIRLSLERNGQPYETVVRPERHCTAGAFPVAGSGNAASAQGGVPKTIFMPLAIVERLEDAPLRGALAWRIAELALAANGIRAANASQIDELAALLLIASGQSTDALWSIRSQDSGVQRSLLEVAPALGLPAKASDPSLQASLVSRTTDLRNTRIRDGKVTLLAMAPSGASTPMSAPRASAPVPSIASQSPVASSASELPRVNQAGQAAYQRFINRASPKAFIVSQDGRWAAAWGRADAVEHALQICRNEGGQNCTPYSINDRVVAKR